MLAYELLAEVRLLGVVEFCTEVLLFGGFGDFKVVVISLSFNWNPFPWIPRRWLRRVL